MLVPMSHHLYPRSDSKPQAQTVHEGPLEHELLVRGQTEQNGWPCNDGSMPRSAVSLGPGSIYSSIERTLEMPLIGGRTSHVPSLATLSYVRQGRPFVANVHSPALHIEGKKPCVRNCRQYLLSDFGEHERSLGRRIDNDILPHSI